MTILENDDERRTVAGRVKWFDPAKGFGFVIADEGGRDILLHANVLRNFGQSSLADGSGITLIVQKTERGIQAYEVLSIAPPDTPLGGGLSDIAEQDPEYIASRPLEPARVKWFDKTKGFGFANVFGRDEDVFVHFEVLRRSGLADLQPGEAVGIRAVDGRRGRMATQVTSWETALRPDDIILEE